MFGFNKASKDILSDSDRTGIDMPLNFLKLAEHRQTAPAAARASGQAGGASYQRLTLEQNGMAAINQAFDAAMSPDTLSQAGGASESYLVQGSVTGVLNRTEMWRMGPMFEGGPPQEGGFGEGTVGVQQAGGAPGEPGAPGAPGAGAPEGGAGGRGGGAMGGPGMGGPGGPGGFGGRGGFGGGRGGGRGGSQSEASLSPEQRERLRDFSQRRLERMGGTRQNLGNRSGGRNRNMIRAGLTYNLGSSALDAASYSLNGIDSQKPSWTRQTFGANVGGPVPFLSLGEDRQSFAFLSYQGTRSRNAYSSFSVVPDAAERTGDFSQSKYVIYDPLSNSPFSNNIIPTDRIGSAAKGLLSYYPSPNMSSSIQNYALVSSIPSNSDSLNLRLMQTLSSTDRLNFDMGLRWSDSTSLQSLGFQDTSQGRGQNFSLGWSHTLNPSTTANVSFRYNANRNAVEPYFAYGEDVAGLLGITGTSREPVNYGPPNLSFTNFASLTDAAYSSRRTYSFNTSGSISMVRGSHTITYGFLWIHQRLNSLTEQDARGTFTFSGASTSGLDASGLAIDGTGFDMADFLLGMPQQTTVRYNGADTYLRDDTYSGYAQDVWRATSNITVNAGLRYEYFAPFTEKYGRMANLDIAPDFSAVAVVTPGSTGPYSGVFPDGLINPDKNNFSPRIGIAWKPTRKAVLRTGYSVFFDGSVFGRIPGRLASQPPFAVSESYVNGVDGILTLTDGFPGTTTGEILNTYAVNRNYGIPYAQTWNFTMQYTLPSQFMMDVGYLGTKGTGLVIQRLPNRVPAGATLSEEEQRRIANATGFTYDSTEGNSIFHALQVRVSRRMRRGIAMNTLYTFSKAIDNASTIGGTGATVVQNDQDLSAERGLSSFDRRHALSTNFSFTSPVGPMGIVMRQDNLLTKILRNWNLNGGVTFQSGTPFTARVLGNLSNAGGSGSVGNARAQATGLLIDSGSGYFNTSAFSTPAAGEYGNAGRNTIPGPATFSLNASIGRSFRLGDSFRRQIMVRLDSQNLTNAVNIAGIGTVVNSKDYGLATSAGNMRQVTLSIRVGF